jgi:hypothetical protein
VIPRWRGNGNVKGNQQRIERIETDQNGSYLRADTIRFGTLHLAMKVNQARNNPF